MVKVYDEAVFATIM